MCVSRDRERDSLVNKKYLILYICTTILIEKMIPFYRSNLFSFLDKKTRILNAFLTTKTMQIYLYIGVNQLNGNVLKVFSLPTHLSYIKKFI